jgi:hypothetical protein
MKAPGYAPSVGLTNQALDYQKPVDTSALERGLGQLGDAIAYMGEDYQKEQDRAARFKTMIDFSNLQTKLEDNVTELWRASKPGSTDLLPQVNKMLDTEGEAFLKNVPDKLRPEFEWRLNRLRPGYHGRTIDYQYKQNDEFYKAGSEAEFLKSQISLQNDPSPENLIKEQAKMENFIRSRNLPESDKETMVLSVKAGLQGISLLHDKQNQAWAGTAGQQVGPKISTPDDYYTRLEQIERGQNPHSSAHGRFGFIDSTRRELGLGQNPTREEEDKAIRTFTEKNRAGLRSALGRDPTPGELYLAHQQGLGGAVKLLQNPNAPVESVIGAEAARLNGAKAGMTAGQFAEKWMGIFERRRGSPHVGLASTDTNPLYKDVPFDQRLKIDKAIGENLRAQLARSVPDELTSLEVNGAWNGVPPSREAFQAAYEEQAQNKWDEYQKGRETALAVHSYQTMPQDQIQADLTRAREAVGTGPGSADAAKSLAARAEAATKVLDARDKTPGDSVYYAFPEVRGLWDNIKKDDPSAVANAVMLTLDKQAQLGIPANKRQPLPTHEAENLAALFTDETKPVEQRAAGFFATVNMTSDPVQQLQIANQMIKSGKLPAAVEEAVIAAQRGDKQGTLNLFAAAMAKPDDWPLSGTNKQDIQGTKDEIDQFLSDNLKAPGSRGYIYYGLAAGDPANAARANRDTQLLEADVRMRLSRGEELEDAKQGALKDLFGDTTIIDRTLPVGGHVSVLVPPTQDEATLIAGMSNLVPKVRAVVEENATAWYNQNSGVPPITPDISKLNLTPQEQSLYSHHLNNLNGSGKLVQPDGQISTVLNTTVEQDGRTFVIPTVWDGKQLSPQEAIQRAGKAGWDKWPSYASKTEAEARYNQLHASMEADTQQYQSLRTSNQKLIDSKRNSDVNDIMTNAGGFQRYGGGDAFGWFDKLHHGFVADTKGNVLLFTMSQIFDAAKNPQELPYRANIPQGAFLR